MPRIERQPLTERQAQVVDAVATFFINGLTWPTYREVCIILGFKSPNAVIQHLRLISQKGWLCKQHQARGLMLAGIVEAVKSRQNPICYAERIREELRKYLPEASV